MSGKISYTSEANEAAESAFRALIGWNVAAQFDDEAKNGDYRITKVYRDGLGFAHIDLQPVDEHGEMDHEQPFISIDLYADGFEIEVY